jgi:hypothetical protein
MVAPLRVPSRVRNPFFRGQHHGQPVSAMRSTARVWTTCAKRRCTGRLASACRPRSTAAGPVASGPMPACSPPSARWSPPSFPDFPIPGCPRMPPPARRSPWRCRRCRCQLRGQNGDSWQIVRRRARPDPGFACSKSSTFPPTLHAMLEQPGAKQSLTRMKPGTELAFDLPVGGGLRAFRYDRDDTHRVELSLVDGDKVNRKSSSARPKCAPSSSAAPSASRCTHSARKLGLSGGAINTLTDDIFKYDIDFNEDVRQRPLQRRGRADLARRRAVGTGPVQARPSPSAASCIRASASSATARPNTSPRRPPAEEELHPHADPVRAPDLDLRHRASIRCWAACACTRASTTPPPPVRRSWPPAMRASQFVGWKGGYGRA